MAVIAFSRACAFFSRAIAEAVSIRPSVFPWADTSSSLLEEGVEAISSPSFFGEGRTPPNLTWLVSMMPKQRWLRYPFMGLSSIRG
jgi:hypothetical protein